MTGIPLCLPFQSFHSINHDEFRMSLICLLPACKSNFQKTQLNYYLSILFIMNLQISGGHADISCLSEYRSYKVCLGLRTFPEGIVLDYQVYNRTCIARVNRLKLFHSGFENADLNSIKDSPYENHFMK